MKGNPKVIDYLNKALRHELTAVNQYWLQFSQSCCEIVLYCVRGPETQTCFRGRRMELWKFTLAELVAHPDAEMPELVQPFDHSTIVALD
jgi:hypothetical protein